MEEEERRGEQREEGEGCDRAHTHASATVYTHRGVPSIIYTVRVKAGQV